ncbi:hypothetical protein THIAE_00105 [Thiomicrospira aerophila AL3]|uniref:Diguanylate cyclase n=1 Tax=Thiomicrospira aerophila AL3 TaxID=717772 RepID=W0DYX3_9GAMM|nr:bifunctional diguanylate cyclase/phosphodiesterase [Thiomicrospira aerophila]AHF02164.1 hypothetical protein THIAE_00105 [Thiomicrospira aerophila AL3]
MNPSHPEPLFTTVFDWVLESMPLIVFVIDEQGYFKFSKGQGLEKLGIKDNEVVGLNYRDVYADNPAILNQIEQALQGKLSACSSYLAGRHYQLIYRQLHQDDQNYLVGIALDQTALINFKELSQQLNTELLQAYDISQQGMWSWDIITNRIDHNQAWRDIFAYQSLEDPSQLSHFTSRIHPEDFARVWQAIEQVLATGDTFTHTYRIITPVGERLVHDSGRVLHYDKQGQPIKMIGSLIDLTDQFNTQKKLSTLLHNDQLTGLSSRFATQNAWHKLRDTTRDVYAFVLLDIQNFKLINDVLGHAVGDLVLQRVANHLKAFFSSDTHISRIHKDDFLLIMPYKDIHELTNLIERALEAIKAIQVSPHYPIKLMARAGISLSPEHGERFDALFHCAETALHKAKKIHNKDYVLYEPAFAKQSEQYLVLLSQMQAAQQNGEFSLVFQPQLNLSSKKCVGAEVLLRWCTSKGESIPPSTFIPIAEQTRLIIPITYWLIEKSLAYLRSWHKQGFDTLYLAINIPAEFLSEPNIVDYLVERITAYTIPPYCLELEITESQLVEEGNDIALKNISALAERGFLIAIDDFGTGYSNLAQLRKLAVKKLKIDKSLVDDLGQQEHDDIHAITQAVIALAQALKLTVIAEGVETSEQKQWLEQQGCGLIQGYFFAKPMDEQQFIHFLSSHCAG